MARVALAGGMLLCAAAAQAQEFQLDIAPAINADPEMSRDIAALCRSLCFGDERRSWLESAVLTVRPNEPYSTGRIVLQLRSKQAFISNTDAVVIDIRVDNLTCEAEATSVDARGITGLALDAADGLLEMFKESSVATMLGNHNVCPDGP